VRNRRLPAGRINQAGGCTPRPPGHSAYPVLHRSPDLGGWPGRQRSRHRPWPWTITLRDRAVWGHQQAGPLAPIGSLGATGTSPAAIDSKAPATQRRWGRRPARRAKRLIEASEPAGHQGPRTEPAQVIHGSSRGDRQATLLAAPNAQGSAGQASAQRSPQGSVTTG